MVSRAGEFPSSSELPSVAELQDDAPLPLASRAQLPTPPLPPAPTPGTAVLVETFNSKQRGVWLVPSKASPPDPAVATLERSIRNNPAYQSLSKGDKAVANWLMWRASMAPPLKQLYYLNKLDTLFKTPYDKPRSVGAAELAKETEAEVDESVARERARGNVFKGEEELQSSSATFSLRPGWRASAYRIDARDPRAVVVKVKIHLEGKPEFVAKIKEFEDSIEKRSSVRGYTLDVEFVNKGGSDVFSVKADPEVWGSADNLAGGIETLAHEIHHLLGLDDRYDLIESHADNKALPVNERLYMFAIQLFKPPDPRGPASLMNDLYRGTLLSEDVCALKRGPQKACIDARKEFDPPGLPPHGPYSVH